MSDTKTKSVQFEGTQFYRRSKFAEVLRIIMITVAIFGMLSVLSAWFIIDSGARHAYKEARDIRKALRSVGTEYYGEFSSIYDPNNADGLAEGAAEKIAELSRRNGTVVLREWDDKGNGPICFEYSTGLYRVIYNDTGSDEGITTGVEGDFKVYYSFELLKYEAQ